MHRPLRSALCLPVALLPLALWPCAAAPQHAGNAAQVRERAEALTSRRHQTPEDLRTAIRLYEQALAEDPDDYETLWTLSKLCQICGQALPPDARQQKIDLWEKGRTYGRRAQEVNPSGKEGHFYAMSNLGSVVQIQGKLSGLWNVRRIKGGIDRTLELDPDFPPALVARAQYLTRMPGLFGGDEKEALRLYRRALEVDPRYYIAHYYLAELYAEDGQVDRALESLDRILHCPEEDRTGSWSTIDRPWAEALRREILEKQAARSR